MTDETIFTEAVRLPLEERGAYLDEACAGDAEKRARLEKLLRSHEAPGSFLAQPVLFDPEATLPLSATERETISARASEQEGDILGAYKLREQLGEGGFGTVWVADQERPVRRRVALKIIKLGMDTKEVIARFEQERQALAKMDHPNIAKVLDAGTTPSGRPFFVMELVRGIPITDYCDQNNLPTGERLALFAKVCHAVQHAHQKGIIHRDIKPSNILVTLYDGVPVPKVIDFGIAKATEGHLSEATIYTQLHQLVGTPAYMSPEQAEMSGLDMDTRSDIYSLGVLLYELLAGRTPFDGRELLASGIDAMRKTIREQDPLRPSNRLATLNDEELTTTAKRRATDKSHLLHQCRGDLDWIVMKCLEKDRTRRYETANGLAADITRHLANEPVTARPPSAAYRLQKSWRRNKVAYAAATAVLFTLVTGIVVSTWQAVRATRAEKAAIAEAQRAATAEKAAQDQELDTRRRAYATDMLLCRRALTSHNLREARLLLDRQRPENGQSDLRDWQWRMLWQACRSGALFELKKQENRVLQALCVDDGKSIITYEDGGAVRRINLSSRHSETLQEPVETSFLSLRSNSGLLCASHDRRWIAALLEGEKGYFVRIWDLAMNTPPRTVEVGETRVSANALSPDGARLVTYVPEQDSAYVWDVVHPGPPHRLSSNLNIPPKILSVYGAVRFSPDGRTLAIGGALSMVRIINVTEKVEDWTERGRFTIEPNSNQGIAALDYSPDGRVLACGSMFLDPRVCIADVGRCEKIRFLSGHKGFIAGLAFSHDGKALASASADQTVKTWDVETWRERGTHMGHTDEVWCVDFLPDGKRLVSGGKDRQIAVWSATTFFSRSGSPVDAVPTRFAGSLHVAPGCSKFAFIAEGVVTLAGHSAQVAPPELGANNDRVFWTSPNQIAALSKSPLEIKLWNLSSNKVETFPLESGGTEWVTFQFFPQPQMLLVIFPGGKSDGMSVIRWDIATRQTLSSCNLPVGEAMARQPACFSHDGRLIAVSNWDSLSIYDIASGSLQTTLAVPSRSGIQGMALSPDGKQMAVADRDRPAIMVKEVATGRTVTTLHGHNLVITKLEYSPDGSHLLSAAIGSEPIKVWGTRDWEEVSRLEPPPGVYYAVPQFTSDGAGIVVFGYEFGKGWIGAHLFRAPSWDEIAKAEAGNIE